MATIKAGTYRFNDVLSQGYFYNDINGWNEVYFDYQVDVVVNGEAVTLYCTAIYQEPRDEGVGSLRYTVASSDPDLTALGITYPCSQYVCSGGTSWATAIFGKGIQTITLPTDQEVSTEFYEWFVANAVEVTEDEETTTDAAATVRYNGSVIASLAAGAKATLACAGKLMKTDVVVEVGEVESNAIDEIFPADTWNEGECTFEDMGISYIKYKYRADRTDPKDIAFDVEVRSDYHVVTGSAANLLEYHMFAFFDKQTRIEAPTGGDKATLLRENPVIITEVDWTAIINIILSEFGVTVDYFIGEATFAMGKNFSGDASSVNNYTTIAYKYKFASEYAGSLADVASVLYAILPLNVTWYYEGNYAYSNNDNNRPVFQISNYDITANGTYNFDQYSNGATGVRSVTVDVPIPDGYIQPTGTLSITENGTYDVSEYASAEVAVESSGGAIVRAAVKQLTLLEATVVAEDTTLTIG